MSSDLEFLKEHIKLIDDHSNKLVYGYIHSTQSSLIHTNNHKNGNIVKNGKNIQHNNSYYQISESIYIQCLLFYYIDYNLCNSMGCIYDMFIDPTFCSNPVTKTQWQRSLQEIDFEYDIEIQQQLFDIMKQNEDSIKIYKSDFIIFTTNIYYPYDPYKSIKNLQEILLEAIDIDEQCQEYIDRKAKSISIKSDKLSKVMYRCKKYVRFLTVF